jgi:predicted nucleic acid-binding protein
VSRIVVDTGPCLNFLSLREGNLLHEVLCPDGATLSIPDVVEEEVRRKSREDARFGPAARVLDGMRRSGKFELLVSDYDDDDLMDIVAEISPRPVSELLRYRAKDVGEIFAISHAVLLRNKGFEVELLLEDNKGRQWAADAGFTSTTSSLRVLARAAQAGLRTKEELQTLFTKMRPLDSRFHGVTWQMTGLADQALYPSQGEPAAS